MKAIIFDCDGVLADTERLKYKAWQHAFASRDIPFSVAEYKQVVGHTSEHILAEVSKIKGIELDKAIIAHKRSLYEQMQFHGVLPIQAAIDYLKFLHSIKKKEGFSLGLASSASRAEIDTNLAHLGLAHIFDSIVSGKDNLEAYQDAQGVNKPKPYIYLEIAKKLHVSPTDCIVFEDSQAGVEAAATAGCYTVAVPNEFTEDHSFEAAQVTLHKWDEIVQLKAVFSKQAPIFTKE